MDETLDEGPPPLTPLCGEAEFDAEVAQLVAEEAPRLFAIVQEHGERFDAWVAAWGMDFEDHVTIVKVERVATGTRSLESAVRRFSRPRNITARVVWVNPDAAPPFEQ